MAAALYTSSSISTPRYSPDFSPRISPILTRPPSSISNLRFPPKISPIQTRRLQITATPALKPVIVTRNCFKIDDDHKHKRSLVKKEDNNVLNWPIFKRWDVPWSWQTLSVTSLACGLSPFLPDAVEAAISHYSWIKVGELSLNGRAQFSLVNHSIATIVGLGVLYSLTKSSSPLPDDIYRYDWRNPFDLRNGWLLWAGVALSVSALFPFSHETHALKFMLPYIEEYSTIRTACMVGIVGVLGPIVHETIFRGFFMVSLTKWLPTPLAVLVSAFTYAVSHVIFKKFPHTFDVKRFSEVLLCGIVLGFSYAQTHNLLTPITIHALWKSAATWSLAFS